MVMDNTSWISAGQVLYVGPTGGYYSVNSVTNATTLVVTNLGYAGNASPSVVINPGSKVGPAATSLIPPSSTTVNAVPRWSNTTGTSLSDSYVYIDGVGNIDASGLQTSGGNITALGGQILSQGVNATTATGIDWDNSNVQSSDYTCIGAFTFTNMRDGGLYTLAVKDVGTAQCNFGQAGLTFRYNPPNAARAGGLMYLYRFTRIGFDVFVKWEPYQ